MKRLGRRRNASFRAIMFYVSLFMYNTWAVEQYRADSSYDRVTLALARDNP